MLMESDIGTTDFEGQPGGVAHKVIRWAFEQQGSYQPPGSPTSVRTPGSPPEVDVFIDDGRGGEYTPQTRMMMDTTDLWSRRRADGGTGHEAPVTGNQNFVYVRVGNRGSTAAQNVTLRLFKSDNPVDPVWPDDWISVGTANSTRIAEGEEVVVGPIEFAPAGEGDKGLLASVSVTEDESNLELVDGSISTSKLVHCDNNIAFRKVTVVRGTPSEPEVTVEATPDLQIPDNTPVGVASGVVFPNAGTITQVGVFVDIRHTWIGDFRVTLSSPSGSEVLLHDKSGGSADDLIRSFSSETDAVLAVLKGEPAEGTWRLRVADLVGQDTGTLRRWSLIIGLEADTSAVRRDSNPIAAIPDANAQGVSDTITVNRSGTLRSIAVPLNVRHTFIGDLEIMLTSPNGTAVLLHDNQGGGADDIVKTYTRDNLPEFAALQGEAIQEDWTFKIVDPAGVIAATRAHVEILHTFLGDLRVALTSPNGSEVVLHDKSGGGEDNLVRSYTSEDFAPLRALTGEPDNGQWRLQVADLVGQDTGTLVRWSLELTYAV